MCQIGRHHTGHNPASPHEKILSKIVELVGNLPSEGQQIEIGDRQDQMPLLDPQKPSAVAVAVHELFPAVASQRISCLLFIDQL